MEKTTPKTNSNQPDLLTEEIIKEIKAIRDTGETNMFLINNVFRLAANRGYFALANFLTEEKNRRAYTEFILYGKNSQEQ